MKRVECGASRSSKDVSGGGAVAEQVGGSLGFLADGWWCEVEET